MSLTVLTDTFGTVEEMDTYFTKIKYVNTDFTDTDTKEAYLFESYMEMRAFCDQESIAWYYFDASIVPTDIKYAQFELVRNMLINATTSSEPTSLLKSLKTGSAQLVFENDMNDKKNVLWTERIKGLLRNQCYFNEPGEAILNVW